MTPFFVRSGETLDLLVNITSDEHGKNNSLWLRLYQDGVLVAASIDDGNKGDDNDSVSLLYKATMNKDSVFEVKAYSDSNRRGIPPTQLQFGYKTYGLGHELNILN